MRNERLEEMAIALLIHINQRYPQKKSYQVRIITYDKIRPNVGWVERSGTQQTKVDVGLRFASPTYFNYFGYQPEVVVTNL